MDRSQKLISEGYLNYVRMQPCLVCGHRPVDPDHLKARGLRQAKRNDLSAVPLCRKHHTERGQVGNEKFEEKYDVNLWEEAFYLICDFHYWGLVNQFANALGIRPRDGWD